MAIPTSALDQGRTQSGRLSPQLNAFMSVRLSRAPSAPTEALDESLDESRIDALVGELRRLCSASRLNLMVQVGELLLERIYAGDVSRWQTRGRKDVSFRKLSRHPALPFRASTLSRAISTYLLTRRRPELLSSRHVSIAHIQEVLPLAPAAQDQFLNRAEVERWSVQKLRSQIRATQGDTRPTKGKPNAIASALHRARSQLDARRLLTDLDQLESPDVQQLRTLLELARLVSQEAHALTVHICRRVEALELGMADESAGDTDA